MLPGPLTAALASPSSRPWALTGVLDSALVRSLLCLFTPLSLYTKESQIYGSCQILYWNPSCNYLLDTFTWMSNRQIKLRVLKTDLWIFLPNLIQLQSSHLCSWQPWPSVMQVIGATLVFCLFHIQLYYLQSIVRGHLSCPLHNQCLGLTPY